MEEIIMRKGYKKVSGIKNVKYKGFHPIDKKKFISKMNGKIDKFNEYWIKNALPQIQIEIGKIFDKNNVENLKKILENNKVKVSSERIKKTIEKGRVSTDPFDPLVILNEISDDYRDRLKYFIVEITEDTPEKTLKDKNKLVDEFFGPKGDAYPSDDEFKSSFEKAIAPELIKQFERAAKKEEEEKLLLEDDDKVSMITFIKKFVAHTKNYNDKDYPLANDLKENIIKAFNSLKKLIKKDGEGKFDDGIQIVILREAMQLLANSKDEIKNEVRKDQTRTKSFNAKKQYGVIRGELLTIVKNATTCHSENIKKCLKAMATNPQNAEAVAAPVANQVPAAPQLAQQGAAPAGKKTPPPPPPRKQKAAPLAAQQPKQEANQPIAPPPPAKNSSGPQVPPPPNPEILKPPVPQEKKAAAPQPAQPKAAPAAKKAPPLPKRRNAQQQAKKEAKEQLEDKLNEIGKKIAAGEASENEMIKYSNSKPRAELNNYISTIAGEIMAGQANISKRRLYRINKTRPACEAILKDMKKKIEREIQENAKKGKSPSEWLEKYKEYFETFKEELKSDVSVEGILKERLDEVDGNELLKETLADRRKYVADDDSEDETEDDDDPFDD